MKDPLPSSVRPTSSRERSGEKAIVALYILFFGLWLLGYWLGLVDPANIILGLPLWFMVSCIWSFIGVFIALLFVSRRFFS